MATRVTRPPSRRVYLAVCSRSTERPINTAITGPSAAGKSHTVETACSYHPPEAVHEMTASSERALIYTDADLRHRYLVVAEAAGLHRDGIGATIIRELAWGARGVTYDTVEKVDGEMVARRIEKPGPTGLITTTTRTLDPEVSTRLLQICYRRHAGPNACRAGHGGPRGCGGHASGARP